MSLPPDLEREFHRSLRQARMVAMVCCFLAPLIYTYSFGAQKLQGRWLLFLAGFGGLDWRDHRVAGALATAVAALVLALVLPGRLGRMAGGRTSLSALRGRNLLTSALLLAVAISGLWLGMKVGEDAASLCLVLFLLPPLRGLQVFPSEPRWRKAIANAA
jgi:ABC-type spermidine/putrescine transport system permease subunit II